MRCQSSVIILASLLVSVGFAAFAADLDHPYRVRSHRPAYQTQASSAPPPRIYTRPVVGFYGYPFDYLERGPRSAYQPGPHPFMYAQPPGPIDPAGYGRPQTPMDTARYDRHPAPTYDFH